MAENLPLTAENIPLSAEVLPHMAENLPLNAEKRSALVAENLPLSAEKKLNQPEEQFEVYIFIKARRGYDNRFQGTSQDKGSFL